MQQCGSSITPAQARSFGTAPQLRWTRALDYDRRPVNPQARTAHAIATAAQLFRQIAHLASVTTNPENHDALNAVIRTCDATLANLGPHPNSIAASWLRRCHAAVPLAEDELANLREVLEQAQCAAARRHASSDSWRDWVAAATALGGSAAHAYIRGREAWQPAVVRRRADLRLTGRSDCIIAHHTQP